jgi:hypothetical protein
MYNRLLFHCPQLAVDVIFAAVSNQCPQRPLIRKTLPALNVAAEGMSKYEKEAFLRKLRTAKGFSFEEDCRSRQSEVRTYSPPGE